MRVSASDELRDGEPGSPGSPAEQHCHDLGYQVTRGVSGDEPFVTSADLLGIITIGKLAEHRLDAPAGLHEPSRHSELSPPGLGGFQNLSPHLEHLRTAEWLVVSEVQGILGFSRNAAHQWIADNSIAKRRGERRVIERRGHGRDLIEVRFGDVERTVLSLLPKDFPYVNGDRGGHRYSEALLVVPFHALHASKTPWKCMFEAIGYEQFHVWLRDRIKNVPPSSDEAATLSPEMVSS